MAPCRQQRAVAKMLMLTMQLRWVIWPLLSLSDAFFCTLLQTSCAAGSMPACGAHLCEYAAQALGSGEHDACLLLGWHLWRAGKHAAGAQHPYFV